MTDLQDFLAARIYDDEQLAREIPAPARWDVRQWAIEPGPAGGGYLIDASLDSVEAVGEFGDLRHALHASQWDPARVLLECEAKKGILLAYMAQVRRAEKGVSPYPQDLLLRYLALPYRYHPEWSEAWLPPVAGTVETFGRQ